MNNLKNLLNDYFELSRELLCLLFRFMMLQLLLISFLLILLYICLLMLKCLTRILAKYQMPHLRKHSSNDPKPLLVGFFHPYCNAGGGGERVLWSSIKALQQRYNHVRCVVYTGDVEATRDDILHKIKERFNIDLLRTDPISLSFCYLQSRKLVEASTYPRLTLLGQSLGSVFLGLEALFKFIPDIYIDSMGYAFTLPLFKYLAGCRVACYVHYPTISSEMLQVVSNRENAHNNASFISQSGFLSSCKLIYYNIFAYIYGFVGRFSDVVMVNSTWTKNHINDIWKVKPVIVYPPCNVKELLMLPVDEDQVIDGRDSNMKYVVSIGQFRPEKNHQLQLKSFKRFLDDIQNVNEGEFVLVNLKTNQYKLVLVGSCRNEEDSIRVNELRNLAEELNISSSVDFKLNISFNELKDIFKKASIGLHTMWNEHFGIGIVECMAAGVIMLAHDSGGPKMDIIKDYEGKQTGFLASDEKSYAEKMAEIFVASKEKLSDIKESARSSVKQFSDEEYHARFLNAMEILLTE